MANGAVPSDAGRRSAYDAQGVARLQRALVLVHAMRPDDLLGGGEVSRDRFVGKLDQRLTVDESTEFATAGGDDPSRLAKLVLLGRQRFGIVGFALSEIGDPA